MWFTMIKKSLFAEIGYLDENMNLYSQDIDFGYRARKDGHVTSFVDAPIKHYTSSTTGRIASDENEAEKVRSKEFFKQKWGLDHDDI